MCVHLGHDGGYIYIYIYIGEPGNSHEPFCKLVIRHWLLISMDDDDEISINLVCLSEGNKHQTPNNKSSNSNYSKQSRLNLNEIEFYRFDVFSWICRST